MKVLRVFIARLRGLFGDARADVELREELESHLAMHIDENIRRGMTPEEARRDALLAAGGLTVAAEAVRDRRGLPWVESLFADVRYAIRTLRLHRGYSAAMILTVALGIGANVTMFTIINAVVLRPLPYPEPDRLLSISIKDKRSDMGVVPDRTYAEWQRASKSVVISTSSGGDALFTLGGETESVVGRFATAGYFDVLGVRPLMGRVFTPAEDIPDAPNVIVLSEQFWRRRLSADPAVVGKTLTVDGKPTTVLGVMPASYTTDHGAQFWVPYRLSPPRPRETRYYSVTARLRDGVSMDAARAELGALQARLEAADRASADHARDENGLVPVVMTLHDRRYGDTRKPLLLLFGAVGVLLLIACANLANLSLARAARREREFVVRLALGAGRWRLARHVLCESLLLSIAGAALGLALSTIAVGYFVRLSPKSVGNVEGIRIDAHVLLFTVAIAVLTGLIFGLVPARAAGRGNLSEALSNGSPRAVGSRRQRWVRRVLVVTQLATALVLMTGAGILARTFWRVTALDLGFRADHLLFVQLVMPHSRYTDANVGSFYDDVMARLRVEPGVVQVALTNVPPVSGVTLSVSSTDSSGKSTPVVDVVNVGPGYLEAIGAHVVEGRTIAASDRLGAPKAAVITETTARLLFPDGRALGRTLPFNKLNVVGIIKDIRQRELEAAPSPSMYVAAAQSGLQNRMALTIRTTDNPDALMAGVRRVLRQIDPALPAPTLVTMDQKLANAVAPRRFTFLLLGVFALLAGALAVVGLYGVLAYLVAERTREIGIRLALGADATRVRRLVIGQGMALTAIGVAIGVVAAGLAVRTLRTMVYQGSVYDSRAFGAGVVLLAVVAYVACYLPARRASRVDPMLALRAD